MNELDFMPLIFKNFYSDPSTVGFIYCKDGIISAEYKEDQIRIQDKHFQILEVKHIEQYLFPQHFSIILQYLHDIVLSLHLPLPCPRHEEAVEGSEEGDLVLLHIVQWVVYTEPWG